MGRGLGRGEAAPSNCWLRFVRGTPCSSRTHSDSPALTLLCATALLTKLVCYSDQCKAKQGDRKGKRCQSRAQKPGWSTLGTTQAL